ncbi:hypothetical protein MRX96_042289 [Rhipicephalus microplus]
MGNKTAPATSCKPTKERVRASGRRSPQPSTLLRTQKGRTQCDRPWRPLNNGPGAFPLPPDNRRPPPKQQARTVPPLLRRLQLAAAAATPLELPCKCVQAGSS